MNWAKIVIPVVLILVLIGMVFASVLNNKVTTTPSTTTNTNKNFNNIQDALGLLPSNASYVRYLDMKNDTAMSNWAQTNYWNTMPPTSIFSATPQRDALAVYPAGYFENSMTSTSADLVSLSDFGNNKINESYSTLGYTNSGIKILKANSQYYFAPDITPVVSGGEQEVLDTLAVFDGNSGSASGTYSDLFQELNMRHIAINGMTLETAGDNSTLPVWFPISNINLTADRYYAGVGPTNVTVTMNNTTYPVYSYVAIMHLNQTPSDNDMQYLDLLQSSNEKMGFSDYNVQVYDDYIIIDAHAPLAMCLDDMTTWDFLRYLPGSGQK